MIVEVESNDNCEAGFFGRFKEVRPPRPVTQVRLYDHNPEGEWYWVTGWSGDEQSPPVRPTPNSSKTQGQDTPISCMAASTVCA